MRPRPEAEFAISSPVPSGTHQGRGRVIFRRGGRAGAPFHRGRPRRERGASADEQGGGARSSFPHCSIPTPTSPRTALLRRPPRSFAVVREPIAGSQRGGLVSAAESGERIGSHAGAVLRPGVVRSRGRLVCRKRGLREGQSLSGACCVEQEARIMTGKPLCQRMIAAERLLTDGDRSMKKGLGSLACPASFNRRARLLRSIAVSVCSGPSAFSSIASARSKSGRAPVRSPCA